MKSKRFLFLALLVLVAIGVFVMNSWKLRKPVESDFKLVAVTRGTIDLTVLATGVVQPENRLEIKPAIAGRAEKVLVEEGDLIHAGQTLVWMSSTERAALLDAARARGSDELSKWEDLYRSAPILAPIDGTIILKSIEPGQTFQTTDAILVMSDRLTVQAQVDETDIGDIHVGQPATIVLDAYPSIKIPGKVDKIAFEAKTVSNVTTYIATVTVTKVPKFMRSGMTANATFHVSSKRDILVIPSEAIKIKGQQKIVQVATPDAEHPSDRAIETGISDSKRIEVVSGLAENEQILVPKLSTFLRPRIQSSSPMNPMGNSTPRPKRSLPQTH